MKKYFLIILTMVAAFAFSSYAGTNIFVANTPRVNDNYLADLQNKFKKGVNNVYLAFSIFNQKPVKKNIAVVYPTLVPVKNYMSGKKGTTIGNPTVVPIATKTPSQSDIAKLDPASIPANLFESVSKGVSAYEKTEGEGGGTILKIEKGTTYKVRDLKLPNGKTVQIIDLTGE